MFNSRVFFKFKIGLSLLSCAEKYTLQSTQCALVRQVPRLTSEVGVGRGNLTMGNHTF